jgi:hypothetical protein
MSKSQFHRSQNRSPESSDGPGTFGFFTGAAQSRFGPAFDDRVFDPDVPHIPVALPVPGRCPGAGDGKLGGTGADTRQPTRPAFTVTRETLSEFTVFDRTYRSTGPIDVTALVDQRGRVWMSDPPQERMMMHANAMRSHGSVLVGGLGLGIFPQYAASRREVEGFTIVERSPEVISLIEPVLRESVSLPVTIIHSSLEEYLAECTDRFDTVFLDTWETLEPKRLPTVNSLRNASAARIREGGTILLWGYRWMVEMFVDACERFYALDPAQRMATIAELAERDAASADLMRQVDRYFGHRSGMDRAAIRDRAEQMARRLAS